MIKRKEEKISSRFIFTIILTLILVIPFFPKLTWAGEGVIYVNANVIGSNESGLSWSHACTTIGNGLIKAVENNCLEIWVAAGIYTEPGVVLPDNYKLLGGFTEGDLSLDDRDFRANVSTIIRGGMGSVVTLGQGCLLDGFTISGGNAPDGGGIQGGTQCIIQNNIIKDNVATNNGGAIFIQGKSGVIIRNNIISNNQAGNCGGGVYGFFADSGELGFNNISGNRAESGAGVFFQRYTNIIIRNNLIRGNISCAGGGGGISLFEISCPFIHNNVVVRNEASTVGGGLFCSGNSNPYLLNNTFTKNFATASLEIYVDSDCSPSIKNCIIWNGSRATNLNKNITYTDISTGVVGIGNINQDPEFNDPNMGLLSQDSPCLHLGDTSSEDYLNRDNTRNTLGAYGGQYAASVGPDYDGPQIILSNPGQILMEAQTAEGVQITIGSVFTPDVLPNARILYLQSIGNPLAEIFDVDDPLPPYCKVKGSDGNAIGEDGVILGLGQNLLTIEATDGYGNVTEQDADILVQDTTPPEAICKNQAVELDVTGQAVITAEMIDNGSSDICGLASPSVFPNTFTCADVGDKEVVLTVTDVNGNNSTCPATVSVQDLMSPIAICKNIIVELDATGQAVITAEMIDNGSNDNCGLAGAGLSVFPNTFTCADIGDKEVVLTVTDVHGNISTCTATVSVKDMMPPQAIGKNITIRPDSSGTALITAEMIDNGSSDNCGLRSINLSKTSFTYMDRGENQIELIVTDQNGLSSTCSVIVTVEGKCGDMDGDNEVTSADALAILNCYMETGDCLAIFDVDRDGKITPRDALCILRRIRQMNSCLDQICPNE